MYIVAPRKVQQVQIDNRNSVVYILVVILVSLTIAELIRFWIRPVPIPGQEYYTIKFYHRLLPQVVIISFLLVIFLQCYQDILVAVKENLKGKIFTVAIGLIIFSSVCVLSMTTPGGWVLAIAIALWLVLLKVRQVKSMLTHTIQEKQIHLKRNNQLIARFLTWSRSITYWVVVLTIWAVIHPFCVAPRVSSLILWIVDLGLFAIVITASISHWIKPASGKHIFSADRLDAIRKDLEDYYRKLDR